LIRENFELIFTGKGHLRDTSNYLLSAATTGEKIRLTLKAETGVCTKKIDNYSCPSPGEVVVEGISAEIPLPPTMTGVPLIETVDPPAPIEFNPILGEPAVQPIPTIDSTSKPKKVFKKRKR
jgi:hypothetical protein